MTTLTVSGLPTHFKLSMCITSLLNGDLELAEYEKNDSEQALALGQRREISTHWPPLGKGNLRDNLKI